MATIIITFKVVMESPEIDTEDVKEKIISTIEDYGASVGSSEVEEVAFGIKAVKVLFLMDEKKGSTDALEDKIKELEGVSSLEVVDVRRAVG